MEDVKWRFTLAETKTWRRTRPHLTHPCDCSTPTSTGLHPHFSVFTSPKSVFPGLSLCKLIGKNTQWVFEPVVKKFDCENIENNTIYTSNIDFTDLESQISIEGDIANGNTKKRSNAPTRLGTKLFIGLNCEKCDKFSNFC